MRGALVAALILALLLAPAAARADLRMAVSPMKLHLLLRPGEQRVAAVEVYNNGDEAVRVVTDVEDWLATREGGVDLLPRGAHDRAASAWVSTDLAEFIVPAHGMQIVRVTAALPDTARGAYWTIVFFEGQAEVRRERLGLGTRVRMGTTVYLTAEGTERRERALTAMNVAPAPETGTFVLSGTLANRGNVYDYPTGWFQVLDTEGRVIYQEELAQRVSLPGQETTYHMAWRPDQPGPFQFIFTVDSGQEALLQGVKEFDVAIPVAGEQRKSHTD